MSKSNPRRRRSRSKHSGLPKCAYRLPTGGYVTESTYHTVDARSGKPRVIKVIAHHYAQPDVDQVARALLAIVLDERQDDQD